MVYDFNLSEAEDVELSLGFSTSASVGAANNTLLYIDNLRLLSKNTNIPDAIEKIEETKTNVNVYSLTGVTLRTNVNSHNATEGLPKGIYIIDNKKVSVRK
jgi:hypothetical protein